MRGRTRPEAVYQRLILHIVYDIMELGNAPGRVLFYFLYVGGRFIVLHGYQKKTERAPQREIATARRRMLDWLRRENDASQNEPL
jgi:phage-related protein